MIKKWVTRTLAASFLNNKKIKDIRSPMAFLSIASVVVGVATLVVAVSIMSGFKALLLNSFLNFSGHIDIYPSWDKELHNPTYVMDNLNKNPHVKKATALIESPALLQNNQIMQSSLLFGISPNDLNKKAFILKNMEGNLGKWNNESIIMGYRMANSLGLKVGDTVDLFNANNSALSVLPEITHFTVVGIFNVGMHDYDSNVVFIPINIAKEVVKHDINKIMLYLNNPEDIRQFYQNTLLASDENYRFIDWKKRYGSFLNILDSQKNTVFIVLTMIIILASISVASLLTLLAKSKEKQIAILKTMGATNGDIRNIFLLISFKIGSYGIALGLFLGGLITYNINSLCLFLETFIGIKLFDKNMYLLSQIPSTLHYGELVKIIIITWLVILTFSILPTRKARKLNPIEVLKND